MAGMSLGMSGGDLCPEPARVDTGLLSAFDPYDPGAAAPHAAFYSDYRRQLEVQPKPIMEVIWIIRSIQREYHSKL